MKIIDKYILKGFGFSFLAVFVSMVGLSIVVDMVVNLDEFLKVEGLEGQVGTWDLLGHMGSYYFYRTFEYFQWLCGAVMLVAGAFTVARLRKGHELTALKAGGLSVYRILWPIIACGLLISVAFIVNQEFILPGLAYELTGERSLADEAEAVELRYVRDSQGSLISAPNFRPGDRPETAQMYVPFDPAQAEPGQGPPHLVRIQIRDPETLAPERFIEADVAQYDPDHQGGGWWLKRWVYDDGWKLVIGGLASEPIDFTQGELPGQAEPTIVDFYRTEADPDYFVRQSRADVYNYLSFGSMQRLLDDSAAVNANVIAVAMHQHFSKPVLNIVLLLLGLPFVVGTEGKGAFVSVMICIGLFVLVLGTEYATVEFGRSGHLSPVLAAYLPVLIFTPPAILSMESIKT